MLVDELNITICDECGALNNEFEFTGFIWHYAGHGELCEHCASLIVGAGFEI